jgi:hypothetical protein
MPYLPCRQSRLRWLCLGLHTTSKAAYHQGMGLKLLGVLIVVLYAVSTIVAMVMRSRDIGLSEGLSGWRTAPRRTTLIGAEVVAVIAAAAAATYSTRWTAVTCTLVGIAAAYALVRTLPKKSSEPGARTSPRPAARAPERQNHAAPAPGLREAGAKADLGLPGPGGQLGARPGKVSFQGVYEYGSDVQQGRGITAQHAVTYTDRLPAPAALCGYQYDPADLPAAKTAILWGIGIPKAARCPTCAQALRAQHYALWDIDPWALGRP